MTLLENLQAHKGGLLRLKTQLNWYGHGWDKNPGRICLILDVSSAAGNLDAAAEAAAMRRLAAAHHDDRVLLITVLLLIDGAPKWIRVVDADVEVL